MIAGEIVVLDHNLPSEALSILPSLSAGKEFHFDIVDGALKASAMQTFRFRIAEPSDAEQLGIIGPAIYAECYGHMWNNAAAYAERLQTFSTVATAEFISRSNTKTWLVEQRNRAVGFLSLVIASPDPIHARTDGAEVPRIYLLAPARGKGLAAKLMAEADRYARAMGSSHIWLDAMKQAPWAWQTYQKWGFTKIGETTFPGDMRPEFKPMIVMRRWCA